MTAQNRPEPARLLPHTLHRAAVKMKLQPALG